MKTTCLTLLLLLLTACAGHTPPPSEAERLMGLALEAVGRHDLATAEQQAYSAAMLAADSTEMDDALAMLSLVYMLEGKERQARMVLAVLPREQPLELVRLQEQANSRGIQRYRLMVACLVAILVLMGGGAVWWYRRREAAYRRKTDELLQGMGHAAPSGTARADLASTKLGVDVLYAIQHDANISQMGKREQQAVSETLHIVEPRLAAMLDSVELTPKETFYCIMHYYGKSEQQKSLSFCCTEQALRSTRSRLGKKLDLSLLTPPDSTDPKSTKT